MAMRFTFLWGFLAYLFISASSLAKRPIDVSNLENYANQAIPDYITKDNSGSHPITDEGATLGRVLFYDKKLSTNDSVSCASCHQQAAGFSDPAQKSQGVNGQTGRHSMRLINIRFASETKYFWDERASSLKNQTTKPIKDHLEMGYSGLDGNPDINDLITKMGGIHYYPLLFDLAFGDPEITEDRMQLALAQFIRSIQSFDSKYDIGRAQVTSNFQELPNFTEEENTGRYLFIEQTDIVVEEVEMTRPSGTVTTNVAQRIGGGFHCASCHRPPEFDIDPDSLNNGFSLGAEGAHDYSVTRSPTLRDMFNQSGEFNSPMFHEGTANDIDGIMAHYNFQELDPENTNLDPRMTPDGAPLFLDISQTQKEQLLAFLRTLTGSDVYTNEKWSNPFDESGNLLMSNELRINTLHYSAGSNEISLELITAPGRTYTLWTSPDLSDENWSILQSAIQSDPKSFKTTTGPFPLSESPRTFFKYSEDSP